MRLRARAARLSFVTVQTMAKSASLTPESASEIVNGFRAPLADSVYEEER
jgi:hypothetical protein